MNCHAPPLWNHSQIGYSVFSLLLCVARFGHEHSVHGYDSESVYVSDNGVLTMTLLLALDQSRTCRHVINWEEGDGGGGHTHQGKRREESGIGGEWGQGKLIYYPITLTLVTWRCSSIRLAWPGNALHWSTPKSSISPTVFLFTPRSLSFPAHSFPPTWLLIWNITRCETWTTQL